MKKYMWFFIEIIDTLEILCKVSSRYINGLLPFKGSEVGNFCSYFFGFEGKEDVDLCEKLKIKNDFRVFIRGFGGLVYWNSKIHFLAIPVVIILIDIVAGREKNINNSGETQMK